MINQIPEVAWFGQALVVLVDEKKIEGFPAEYVRKMANISFATAVECAGLLLRLFGQDYSGQFREDLREIFDRLTIGDIRGGLIFANDAVERLSEDVTLLMGHDVYVKRSDPIPGKYAPEDREWQVGLAMAWHERELIVGVEEFLSVCGLEAWYTERLDEDGRALVEKTGEVILDPSIVLSDEKGVRWAFDHMALARPTGGQWWSKIKIKKEKPNS